MPHLCGPSEKSASIFLRRATARGENIVARGAEAKANQLLISRGIHMTHKQIAVATSVGKTHLAVYKRPRIAILSTGDEVVDISAVPGPYQIRNSNSFSLA